MKSLVVAAILASCASLNAYATDLATVNGVAIKQSLLDYIVKDATARGKTVDDNARANIIEKLITTELIDQEAQKSGITQRADFLAKEQLTLQELRVNAFIEDHILKNPIDDQTLQAEYDRRKALSNTKEYKASHILVKTEDAAKGIIAKLASNADFGSLAKENSLDASKDNGGDLGWFAPESMVQPFAEAAVKLQKGSYTSTPVQTEFGWHVIRLDDIRDAQPPSFESVKSQLRSDMQRQKLGQLVDDLRAKARIENNSSAK